MTETAHDPQPQPTEAHPHANASPLIEGAEFDELVNDTQRYGLRDDIVTCGGKVLDGRNRLRARHAGGVSPRSRQH
jgi:hypothetical protein